MHTGNEKNRGYQKIEGAARAFNFDFRGKVVLDIGSSTGGFTQYALDHGAKRVIAIEKGTNQMAKPLRFDKRIDLHEKTDIFDVCLETGGRNLSFEGSKTWASAPERPEKDRFGQDPFPDIIVADVSFVSLRKILSHAKRHLSNQDTEFLVMLKPQFEAEPDELNKGVVKNEKIRRQIIKHFEQWLRNNHFAIKNKRDNQLKGKTGNLERFYYLKLAK